MLAAGAGIATHQKTKLSHGGRAVDNFETGGLLTLFARFFEGWPTANRTLKLLFLSSLLACLAAFVFWAAQSAFA